MGVVQREHGDKARFPWLKTPHMDRLAAQAVCFRNAFVVNSLCAPSRASFLTGQYGHTNGVVNNHMPFPVENATWATVLRAAGYVTGYIGKWHMDGQKGQRPGFDFSASFIGQGKYFDCPVHADWTELFDLARDPYQLTNLFWDAGIAALRRQLKAEYDRQAQAIAFRIPDFADTPKEK